MKKVILLTILWIIFVACYIAWGMEIYEGLASYYTVKSSSNITASGEVFKEKELTCAFMEAPFNSILKVTNLESGKSVIVKVNDRGGFKKYGRAIDLSSGAFAKIAPLEKGLIKVRIERIK